MGIGAEAMKLYAELADEPSFQAGKTVCEFGSQDMQCEGHWWKPAREYMESLGFDYVCIDIDGRHDALKLDLNEATVGDVSRFLRGRECDNRGIVRFDLVTNHGTTEHCFNQHNCFKLMHNLTKVGGLMIHLVPSKPWQHTEDSFYYYSAGLFADLADTNGYEVVRLEYVDGTIGNMVQAVLRRTTEDEFRSPIQRDYRITEEPLPVTPVPPMPEVHTPPELLHSDGESLVVAESIVLTPRTAHMKVER